MQSKLLQKFFKMKPLCTKKPDFCSKLKQKCRQKRCRTAEKTQSKLQRKNQNADKIGLSMQSNLLQKIIKIQPVCSKKPAFCCQNAVKSVAKLQKNSSQILAKKAKYATKKIVKIASKKGENCSQTASR